jgi:hypothetical protein
MPSSASRPSQLSDASPVAPLFLTWSKEAFEVVDAVAGEQQCAREIGCIRAWRILLLIEIDFFL